MKLNKRYIFLILACIFILLSVYFIVQIYGKYLSSASGTTVMPIAKWNIKVNNQNIKDNSDISSTITPVFPGNSYIAANIIAPTAEGYFDLIFDYSAVDVAFKYDITTTPNAGSAVTDLVTTGYSIDGGTKVTFPEYNQTVTDTIPLTATTRTRTIRIYVMWNDDSATAAMNNLSDTTSTTLTTNSAKFDVKVAFTQITS